MVLLANVSQVVSAGTKQRYVTRGLVGSTIVRLLAQVECLLKLGGSNASALLEAMRYITDTLDQARQSRVIRSVAGDAHRKHGGR